MPLALFPTDTAMKTLSDPNVKGIHKYVYLKYMQLHNPNHFYRLLWDHLESILPFVYTPTVGEACQHYSNLPIVQQGLCLSLNDKGNLLTKLKTWPHQHIRVVVVTDGERILGLGDLGRGGIGISEGKILLYTAAAGVPPHLCLPLCLDVGTNNQRLLDDPEYKGLKCQRIHGVEYEEFVEELITALKEWQPHLLLQFEDFGNHNAFTLLKKYQTSLCCFNDDIQGTAAITLAGILAALRISGTTLDQQRILFYGAGEAGTGIGELIALALNRYHGLPLQDARQRCFFMDSQGLVCASRKNLQAHKVPFAHHVPHCKDLLTAIHNLRPSILIGVSTIAGAFSSEVLGAMAAMNPHPIVFPLSNPTSKSECTFIDAVTATKGTVIFASGSPFPALQWNDKLLHPAQANNAYIFPCVGYAAVLCHCRCIPEDVFLRAAYVLSSMQPVEALVRGELFPPLSAIRDVSAVVGGSVLQYMCDQRLGHIKESPKDWAAFFRSQMWQPPVESRL